MNKACNSNNDIQVCMCVYIYIYINKHCGVFLPINLPNINKQWQPSVFVISISGTTYSDTLVVGV